MTDEEREKAIERGDFLEEELQEEEEESPEEEEVEEGEEEEYDSEEEEGEEEEAPEEEGDEEDSEEEDEEGEQQNSQPRIPKARLDREIAKRRKAEEEKQAYEARILDLLEKMAKDKEPEPSPEPAPFDFDAAEEKYQELLIEGDTKAASKLRSEIRKAEREEFLKEINPEGHTREILAERDFSAAVSQHIQTNPALDDASDEYDQDLVDSINVMMRGYVANGEDKVSALDKAVKRLTSPSKKKPAPKLGKDTAREKKSLKNAIRASKAQPEKLRNSKSGRANTDSLDLSKMTEEEYRSLDPKVKRQLRGDNG